MYTNASWVFAYHKESSHKASGNITFGSRNTFCLLLVLCREWVSGKSNCKSTSFASDNKSGLNVGTSFGGRLNGVRRNERDLGKKTNFEDLGLQMIGS
jgi:hypothetical protein